MKAKWLFAKMDLAPKYPEPKSDQVEQPQRLSAQESSKLKMENQMAYEVRASDWLKSVMAEGFCLIMHEFSYGTALQAA
ncbi:hypothetical protein SK128_019078 [Halocaridina rubra]|uniref:Uncharacterized protein n=1 Tax=Halocaridina rubra TaxID=373956 RepID=A0AAN8X8D6_HALRR